MIIQIRRSDDQNAQFNASALVMVASDDDFSIKDAMLIAPASSYPNTNSISWSAPGATNIAINLPAGYGHFTIKIDGVVVSTTAIGTFYYRKNTGLDVNLWSIKTFFARTDGYGGFPTSELVNAATWEYLAAGYGSVQVDSVAWSATHKGWLMTTNATHVFATGQVIECENVAHWTAYGQTFSKLEFYVKKRLSDTSFIVKSAHGEHSNISISTTTNVRVAPLPYTKTGSKIMGAYSYDVYVPNGSPSELQHQIMVLKQPGQPSLSAIYIKILGASDDGLIRLDYVDRSIPTESPSILVINEKFVFMSCLSTSNSSATENSRIFVRLTSKDVVFYMNEHNEAYQRFFSLRSGAIAEHKGYFFLETSTSSIKKPGRFDNKRIDRRINYHPFTGSFMVAPRILSAANNMYFTDMLHAAKMLPIGEYISIQSIQMYHICILLGVRQVA